MDMYHLIGILGLGTLSAVLVFAFLSAEKTHRRLKDPQARKSMLAVDAPSRRPDPPDV